MTCDWIPWKFRHWKELDGVTLTAKYGEDGIEGSFYVYEHYPMENVTLAIRHIRDNLFELEMEMIVDYNGSEYSAPESYLVVKGCAVVPFVGLYLGKEISFDEATEFIELSAFECEASKNEFGRDYYKPKFI